MRNANRPSPRSAGEGKTTPRQLRCADVLTAFAIITDGLVYAAYLFIVAIGLTLIFGVMKILNVTHGSFYAFGAYGAATAVGIYVDAGWPAAAGFLLMIVFAMAIGAGASASSSNAACCGSSTAATKSWSCSSPTPCSSFSRM